MSLSEFTLEIELSSSDPRLHYDKFEMINSLESNIASLISRNDAWVVARSKERGGLRIWYFYFFVLEAEGYSCHLK